jgi:hypothetical protein
MMTVAAYAQKKDFNKPDYKAIENKISQEDSDFFYPKLLQRFLLADTTMSLDEKRCLYYGYTFQKTYSPYGHSDYRDSILLVLRKDDHESKDLLKIIEFSDSLLAFNPFDLRAINYQLYAFEKFGQKTEFDLRINQMRIIIDALLSSGNGRKKKTAFYVISTAHEYDLLSILGYEFGGQQSLIEHYDYLEVAKNPDKIDGLYFDVSPCLNSLNKMFD